MDLRKLSKVQLDELIAKANERKEQIGSESAERLRDKILAMLEAEGLSFEEVFGGRRRRGRGKAAKVAKVAGRKPGRPKGSKAKPGKASKSKGKPKYRNPANADETWVGRGKRPRWFNAALAAGKKEKDLLA